MAGKRKTAAKKPVAKAAACKKGLTQKQEVFCLVYLETGNASEAYRKAYDAQNMKPATVNRKAKELLDNGKIAARVAEVQAAHAERHKLTVDDLLAELEEARQAALTAESVQSSAAVAATMGKAKLLGMDKQVIEHSGPGGKPIELTHSKGRNLSDFYEDIGVSAKPGAR